MSLIDSFHQLYLTPILKYQKSHIATKLSTHVAKYKKEEEAKMARV
jgi:hypothetical protein